MQQFLSKHSTFLSYIGCCDYFFLSQLLQSLSMKKLKKMPCLILSISRKKVLKFKKKNGKDTGTSVKNIFTYINHTSLNKSLPFQMQQKIILKIAARYLKM